MQVWGTKIVGNCTIWMDIRFWWEKQQIAKSTLTLRWFCANPEPLHNTSSWNSAAAAKVRWHCDVEVAVVCWKLGGRITSTISESSYEYSTGGRTIRVNLLGVDWKWDHWSANHRVVGSPHNRNICWSGMRNRDISFNIDDLAGREFLNVFDVVCKLETFAKKQIASLSVETSIFGRRLWKTGGKLAIVESYTMKTGTNSWRGLFLSPFNVTRRICLYHCNNGRTTSGIHLGPNSSNGRRDHETMSGNHGDQAASGD